MRGQNRVIGLASILSLAPNRGIQSKDEADSELGWVGRGQGQERLQEHVNGSPSLISTVERVSATPTARQKCGFSF